VADVTRTPLDISAARPHIEAALAYAGGTHTLADVEAAIQAGDAQLWSGPNSCIVTEIDRQPRTTTLNFFLAGGRMAELEAMTPGILAWGEEQGCATARFLGRRGWLRTFLSDTGWVDTGLVIMERPLNGIRQIEGHQ
jgi:hypothetical protein